MTDVLAWLTPDRGVMMMDRHGKVRDPAIDASVVRWGNFQVSTAQSASFSWPCWSPDGNWLAVFRLPNDDVGARLYAIEGTGVRSAELGDLPGRIPIYLHWSPDGRRIAALCQAGDALQLSSFDMDQLGRETMLAEGTPLFFSWSGDEVLTFVGRKDTETRLELLDPRMTGRRLILPGTPGNFCAPLWLDGTAWYVTHSGMRTTIVKAVPGDTDPTPICPVVGLVAMLPSPDGRSIAFSTAPDGDGSPYSGLCLLDLESGEASPLGEHPCLAFMWSPCGEALITVRVDTRDNLLRWSRVGLDGSSTEFAAHYPTRDLGFYLRFFEQYAQSHRLVSHDGAHILLAGGLDSHSNPDQPRIWKVATDGSGEEELCDGIFAVYGTVR